MNQNKSILGWRLFLRGILVFLVFALLLGGLYGVCLHGSEEAEWSGPVEDVQASLTYAGEVYYRADRVGSSGLTEKNYPQGTVLAVLPRAEGDLLCRVYGLYTVDKTGEPQENCLLAVDRQGRSYVYYKDGTKDPRS